MRARAPLLSGRCPEDEVLARVPRLGVFPGAPPGDRARARLWFVALLAKTWPPDDIVAMSLSSAAAR